MEEDAEQERQVPRQHEGEGDTEHLVSAQNLDHDFDSAPRQDHDRPGDSRADG